MEREKKKRYRERERRRRDIGRERKRRERGRKTDRREGEIYKERNCEGMKYRQERMYVRKTGTYRRKENYREGGINRGKW